jgi:hypothetical protein
MTPPRSIPMTDARERLALADEIEAGFEEIILRTDDGEWSDKRRLTDNERDLIVAALRASAVAADREAIARIIEDNVYRKHNGNWDGDYEDLLVAADAILALTRSQP